MSDAETLRRYALALALVPDPDAAGDLFMDATSEPDLRRRAEAWRRKHGFPQLAEDPPLPALGPEEQELCLHLARRGVQRRRMRAVWRAGAAVLLAAAIGVGGWALTGSMGAGLPAWASDPAFNTRPGVIMEDQVTFSIHKLQATPGTLTVWWSASGPGTLKNAATLHPEASARRSVAKFGSLVRNETARVGNDKVVGRSTFQLLALGTEQVSVGLTQVGERKVSLEITLPAPAVEADPDARTYPVTVEKGRQDDGLFPESVVVGTGYAAVTYDQIVEVQGAKGPFSTIKADGKELIYVTTSSRGGELTDYFTGAAPGAGSLSIQPLTAYHYEDEEVELPLPATLPSLSVIEQIEGENLIQITLEPTKWDPAPKGGYYSTFMGSGQAYDSAGRAYPLNYSNRPSPKAVTNRAFQIFEATGLQPGTRIERIHVHLTHLTPLPAVEIQLQQ